MRIFFRLTIFALVLFTRSLLAQSWQQLPDFPSTERDDGVSFVIGNKAYCGTGLKTGWLPCRDFYVLDMSNDSWDTLAAMPSGMECQYACAFSNNIYGYVLGGVNSSGNVLNDLWQYDPILNNWTQKASKPGTLLAASSAFVIGDTAYVVGGNNNLGVDGSSEVWAYSMQGDSWTQKNGTSFSGRWRASSCSLNGKGYMLFGKDENNVFCRELLEYEPQNDTWQQISGFPGIGRNYAAMTSIGNELFVFGGIDSLNNCYGDMWAYSLSNNQWSQRSFIPSFGRKGGSGFSSGLAFYYTTGIDQVSNRIKETWKMNNDVGLSGFDFEMAVDLFPNPMEESFTISCSDLEYYDLEIFDPLGNLIYSAKHLNNNSVVNPGICATGLFYIRIASNNKVFIKKIIKE